MPEQMSWDFPVVPAQPRLKIVHRSQGLSGPLPEQMMIDFTALVLVIPRRPHRSTICAGATPVTLDGRTMPAMEWAMRRGLKWQTVKMRRMRGDNWSEALAPELRRTTFMSGWRLHG
jgi:hypothetical protein